MKNSVAPPNFQSQVARPSSGRQLTDYNRIQSLPRLVRLGLLEEVLATCDKKSSGATVK